MLQYYVTMIQYAFSTNIGRVRKRQEDGYGNVEDKFFVLADGLGGMPAGDIAAKLAVEASEKVYRREKSGKPSEILLHVFQRANRVVAEEAKKTSNFGMSTTVVAVLIGKRKWWMGNIGDSRGYLFSNDKLRQITRDHEDDLGSITRAVGLEEEAAPDIFCGEAKAGDMLLLTTDGLFEMVNDEDIEKVLAEKESVQQKADKLVQTALEAGGIDNVTVGVIRIMNSEL